MKDVKRVQKTISNFVKFKFLNFWNIRSKNKKINGKSSKFIPKRFTP